MSAKPCRPFCNLLILKDFGSANGGRTRIRRLPLFPRNLLKPQAQESLYSRESQPVCTKHVHAFRLHVNPRR